MSDAQTEAVEKQPNVIFIAENSPHLELRLKDGDPKASPPTLDLVVRFVDKKLELDPEKDREAIIILRFAIANKPNISQLVKEVDRVRALRVAAEFQKRQANERKLDKGASGAALNSKMMDAHQNNIRQTYLAQGMEPDKVENLIRELAQDGYVVPVTGDPIASVPEDGFKNDPIMDRERAITAELTRQAGGAPIVTHAANQSGVDITPKNKFSLTGLIQKDAEPPKTDLI